MENREHREIARGLLAARKLLHAESLQLNARRRKGARRSRQQLRRKRAAEHLAAEILSSKTLPVSVDMSRRKLARVLMDHSMLPDLLSRDEASDLEALLAHRIRTGGKPGKATYWTELGDPPHCEPGDQARARLFYRKIQRAIEQGGWSRSEHAALHVLSRRWFARAAGTDARFMEVGTAGAGRLPRDTERRIKSRG